MNNLHVRLVGNEATMAVLEFETLATEPAVRELRQVLGNAGFRVVSSEGMIADQTLRERIYVSDPRGSALTPERLRQIFVQAFGTLEPRVTCGSSARPRTHHVT